MNLRLLAKHLGTICLLIGGTMLFSLPWALPQLGHRNDLPQIAEFERDGFLALIYSMFISGLVGGLLKWFGGRARGKLFRREAMAIVGLSWIGATLLGGLPFYLSETYRGPSVRLSEPDDRPQLFAFRRLTWGQWLPKDPLSAHTYPVVSALVAAGARGLNESQICAIQPQAPELLRAACRRRRLEGRPIISG